eukprot:gene29000-32193_t
MADYSGSMDHAKDAETPLLQLRPDGKVDLSKALLNAPNLNSSTTSSTNTAATQESDCTIVDLSKALLNAPNPSSQLLNSSTTSTTAITKESECPIVSRPQASTSFYMRPLQPPAVAFSSEEGQQIFGRALAAGMMKGFFKLIEQFTSQNQIMNQITNFQTREKQGQGVATGAGVATQPTDNELATTNRTGEFSGQRRILQNREAASNMVLDR